MSNKLLIQIKPISSYKYTNKIISLSTNKANFHFKSHFIKFKIFHKTKISFKLSSNSHQDRLLEKYISDTSILLDEIIDDIYRESYVLAAVSYVTDDKEQNTTKFIDDSVIKRVISVYLPRLDQNFLALLDSFAAKAETTIGADAADLVRRIHKEVLRQLTKILPPEVALLEILIEEKEKKKRVEIIENSFIGKFPSNIYESLNEGEMKIDPVRLGGAANQFIIELEEQEKIVDRSLLAKLCVIREEIRLFEMELRFKGVNLPESILEHRRNVPVLAMSFVQQLINSNESDTRLANLRKAFIEDWPKNTFRKKPENNHTGRLDVVRPGEFLSCLTLAQNEIDNSKGTPVDITKKIEEIRLESLLVLREMGWGEFTQEEIDNKNSNE